MGAETKPLRFSTPAKAITVAVVVGLTILTLQHAIHVLAPFIAAIITAYLFNPLVNWCQQRTRTPRYLWIIVLYVLAFLLLYGLAQWGVPRLNQQLRGLLNWTQDNVTTLVRTLQENEQIETIGGLRVDVAPVREQLIEALRDFGRSISEAVPHLVFSALEAIIFLLVYFIITFYLLLQSAQLKQWTINLIPAGYRQEICAIGRQIDSALGAFVRGQLILIVIMSVLTYIPLAILRVPYAPIIAIASGILETLPIVGPWSAAGIAIAVASFQTDIPFGLSNLGLDILIGVIYFTLRQIEDHFIIPNVMGPLVQLHPALVIFAILAGGAVAGAFGLFIAIPVAAVGRILLSYLYRKLTDQPEPPAPPPAATAQLGHKKASVVPPTLPPEQV